MAADMALAGHPTQEEQSTLTFPNYYNHFQGLIDAGVGAPGLVTLALSYIDAGESLEDPPGEFPMPGCPLEDDAPPTCSITEVLPGPPEKIIVTVQDSGSGLDNISYTTTNISKVEVTVDGGKPGAGFPVTTTAPVLISATKDIQTVSSRLILTVSDAAGNTTKCDPVLTEVIRATGKPVSQTFTDIPQAESIVTIHNGTPGLTKLYIFVNGQRFKVKGLRDGQTTTLDVSSGMVPGDENIIDLMARGKPGGSATVVISD
jgi:hypothetical protein